MLVVQPVYNTAAPGVNQGFITFHASDEKIYRYDTPNSSSPIDTTTATKTEALDDSWGAAYQDQPRFAFNIVNVSKSMGFQIYSDTNGNGGDMHYTLDNGQNWTTYDHGGTGGFGTNLVYNGTEYLLTVVNGQFSRKTSSLSSPSWSSTTATPSKFAIVNASEQSGYWYAANSGIGYGWASSTNSGVANGIYYSANGTSWSNPTIQWSGGEDSPSGWDVGWQKGMVQDSAGNIWVAALLDLSVSGILYYCSATSTYVLSTPTGVSCCTTGGSGCYPAQSTSTTSTERTVVIFKIEPGVQSLMVEVYRSPTGFVSTTNPSGWGSSGIWIDDNDRISWMTEKASNPGTTVIMKSTSSSNTTYTESAMTITDQNGGSLTALPHFQQPDKFIFENSRYYALGTGNHYWSADAITWTAIMDSDDNNATLIGWPTSGT